MSFTVKLLMVSALCGAIYLVYRMISKQASHCTGTGSCKNEKENCNKWQ
ncbi:MAG: hypothetical protein ACUZ8O_09020 [Candidatus Anammoxibacter sp.]